MNDNINAISSAIMRGIPPQLRREYVKCPDCGMIVSKQNYCPICGNVLGDGATR